MGLNSIYTGISGLNSYGTAMSVIGNNLANVNTVGYKASRVSFADILSQSLTGSSGQFQIGRGVQITSVVPQFSQGSFESTSSATDLAIDGDGFFMVRDPSGLFYTRAGQFIFNEQGDLVSPDGFALQGWRLRDGNVSDVMGNINITAISSAPRVTSDVSLTINLDGAETQPAAAWDAQDPYNTSNYSTTLTVYDTLGEGHMLTIFFRRAAAANTWEYYALVDGNDTGAGTQYEQVGDGTLDFTGDGALNLETVANQISVNWNNGATVPQTIDVNFGESITEGGTGLVGTTQFAGESFTLYQTQDGYAAGNLVNISIDENGRISGLFSNGVSMEIYQIAVAGFESPWEMDMVGRNLYAATNESGQPIIGIPGTSGLGGIAANSLEMSNVDIATEFVNMIRTQQAFQANSRIITTTDQMLQELINLKR
ncbi:MAG: flagellar hook protein FlgE [Deltaproteobacteria bacterium]|nr:flagellar hook protein FlgE [Deltaproteobacteria bacterium]MBW2307937.1 flagellar hook protein FlgE [Deltaproteobacteria bacterium]